MTQLYPAFLSLSGRRTLVVGYGREARKRIKALIDAEADITLVDPDAPTELPGVSTVLQRTATVEDVDQCWLVVCASHDTELNASLAEVCESRRIYCNIVANQTLSTFTVPAVIDRSPLLIAVSTGGVAPVLTRAVKSKLEVVIPAAYSRLARVIGRFQHSVQQKVPDRAQRAELWHRLISGPVSELAFDSDTQQLESVLDNLVASNQNHTDTKAQGFVSLVGAGPGDPDLLTFRALRLIQSTDVLVYDRLVSPAILNLCRDDTEMVYAGKAKSKHTLPQTSINQLLVDFAKAGKNVVRLKGGDPFIFGRGGEEIETLAQHSIPFQVVPGITAATGCAAFSGIPLTHRDHAQSCVFITGHLQDGQINLNWQHLKDPSQTIVVYMGLTGLVKICSSLIEHGRHPETPAALIEQGTTPSQRVHSGTLSSLPSVIETTPVQAPTLLIIGSVVSLREKLNWFDSPDTHWENQETPSEST